VSQATRFFCFGGGDPKSRKPCASTQLPVTTPHTCGIMGEQPRVLEGAPVLCGEAALNINAGGELDAACVDDTATALVAVCTSDVVHAWAEHPGPPGTVGVGGGEILTVLAVVFVPSIIEGDETLTFAGDVATGVRATALRGDDRLVRDGVGNATKCALSPSVEQLPLLLQSLTLGEDKRHLAVTGGFVVLVHEAETA